MNNTWSLKIDAAIRMFIYILIFWLPYSPAVLESCVVTGLLLWIIKRACFGSGREERPSRSAIKRFFLKFKPAKNVLNVPFSLFMVVAFISAVNSDLLEISVRGFITKTFEWMIIYLLVIEVFKERKHFIWAFGIFVFTSMATIIDAIVQFHITKKDFFYGHTVLTDNRATAGFNTPNSLAAYLTIFIPLSFTCLLNDTKRLHKVFAFICFGLSVWALVLTFSRGAWLAVAIGLLFTIIVLVNVKRRLMPLWLLGLLLSSIVVVGLMVPMQMHIIKKTLNFEREQTVDWRLTIWQDSMTMIKDRPVFGHGVNTFMKKFQYYRRDVGNNSTYAHNCYVQLAVETGIFGFTIFIWLLITVFASGLKYLHRLKRDMYNLDLILLGLLSGLVSFLIHSFFDTHWYSLQLSIYLFVTMAIIVSFIMHLKQTYKQG